MRIVCIGGGTGLHILLQGLKAQFPHDELCAVVTMMDSGGSTGRLRDEFGYLPPGDIRQSLVALSEAPRELRALMQHRFSAPGSALDGHVVGNLLLTALKDINGGDEYAAIEAMERLLRIRGKVYPITTDNCNLVAHLEDGSQVRGETNIDIPKHNPELRIERISLSPAASIFSKTRDVLQHADIIIIGPGDLYTSIMPNLVVQGVAEALSDAKHHGAKILYITNTMTKHGETSGFRARDFAGVVQSALGQSAIDAFIVNDGMISADQRDAYAQEHAVPVVDDIDRTSHVVIVGDLVSRDAFARHEPSKLARAVAAALQKLGLQQE